MDENQNNAQPPIEVPLEALSEAALEGIIENFIQREGTDYGVVEVAWDTKVNQVRKQLARGDVKVVFDPNTETVSLMTKHEWTRFAEAMPDLEL